MNSENQGVSDASIEREIQAKGLTAPRLRPSDLDANIAHAEIVKHISKSGQVLRWAVLTTLNGFAVTGKPSASVSPENDDAEIGEKVAFDNARSELWPLMGYALKEQLHANAAKQEARDTRSAFFDASVVVKPNQVSAPDKVIGLPSQAPAIDLDAAVTRFLSWPLPDDFAPDCGISFKRESEYDHPEFGRTKYEPTGSNLLHAGQARAMLEHVLDVPIPRMRDGSPADPEKFGVVAIDFAVATPPIPAYQQRVIDEKRELDENIKRLNEFMCTPLSLFGVLPAEEQTSMSNQLLAMTAYSVALGERIARFGGAA